MATSCNESLTLSPPTNDRRDLRQPDAPCLMCDFSFCVEETPDKYLLHLITEHKIVISDVKLIADFVKYTTYWKDRFFKGQLVDFCSVIQTNSLETDTDPSEFYYLLCDTLPEDKELRIRLQKEKLEEVLNQQKFEREDPNFEHMCLFCREIFTGNRNELFEHMANDHSFSIGHSDNLVYTTELLDHLDEKLHSLQCLFCDKIFKDRSVLKEHMRKKQHKRINPKNTKYDKYYIINYLELGKNWESLQSEEDQEIEESEADDWSDWNECAGSHVVCLLCEHTSNSSSSLIAHMKDAHHLDLDAMKEGLNFYQQVKLINFIRRQTHQRICFFCDEEFASKEGLQRHLVESSHVSMTPASEAWDQPQYFFPTYEDDNLLCLLEDSSDVMEGGTVAMATRDTVVVAEDFPLTDSILNEHPELLSQEFGSS
ncbi:hypothetical protein CAPTEDRAFT_91094 [Capitella teleta]|uniref:C2H2-type domain-containing protein n=1 Tax=Capitella teleta TaxID=283909 RepID=R7UEW9_CAPTE|nr:hypothetical protein CAPTEDRAFT_91094 [Capitella teleta]|eukprot:ELU04760.1 hypothetical protein CAPTEDRAFT_91094 [Capitella teleta]